MAETKPLPIRLPLKIDGARLTDTQVGDVLVNRRGRMLARVVKVTETTSDRAGKARRFRFAIDAEEL